MHPTDKAARIAGAVYLSMVLTAPFSLIYVPNKLIVRGDATASASNILAHETMFRLSIFGDLIGHVIFICLGIALYRRSGFLPRILGIWLIIACFAWIALSITALFFSHYYQAAFAWLQPAFFAEMAIMLWLLIRGAKVPPVAVAAS